MVDISKIPIHESLERNKEMFEKMIKVVSDLINAHTGVNICLILEMDDILQTEFEGVKDLIQPRMIDSMIALDFLNLTRTKRTLYSQISLIKNHEEVRFIEPTAELLYKHMDDLIHHLKDGVCVESIAALKLVEKLKETGKLEALFK